MVTHLSHDSHGYQEHLTSHYWKKKMVPFRNKLTEHLILSTGLIVFGVKCSR